jgi:hypothetical protein
MTDISLLNPWALYAFAVFIPLIILYLLRPKPKNLRIPSLMFIINMEQRKRFRSFMRHFFRDPLLLLQILILTLIILAVANPFYITEETKTVKQNVAIILDVSASMQATDLQPSRFSRARQIAGDIIDNLGDDDKVSLILAENLPIVVLRQGGKDQARSLLDSIGPKDTPTGTGNAILLARDILIDSKVARKIYVISDFSNYEGMDPVGAQKNAFADGIGVEFIRTNEGGQNLGITSARTLRQSGKCLAEAIVDNLGTAESTANLEFTMDGQIVDSKTGSIQPESSQMFSLAFPCSISEHEVRMNLRASDSLLTDNSAYFIIPEQKKYKTLLIRGQRSDEYVKFALESLQSVELKETTPPIFPHSFEDYDIVIFQDSEASSVLPGVFDGLKEFVEKGGGLIVMAFPDLAVIEREELNKVLPVLIQRVSASGGSPEITFDHQILRDMDFDKIHLESYLQADDRVGAVTLLKIGATPLLSYWEMGSGKVLYLGVSSNTSWSNFQLQPTFPIFWLQTIEWMEKESIVGETINFKTGEQLPITTNDTLRVIKPSGQTIRSRDIFLDEAGVYKIENLNKKVAASLLNERESDISSVVDAESLDISDEYIPESITEGVQKELYWILAAAVLALVLAEWFYYKGRGTL